MTNNMKQLTAQEILEADDIEVIKVDVPMWGGFVHLRVLPVGEGLELNEKMQALKKEESAQALYMLLGATLCDEKGKKLFTEKQIEKLATRSTKVLLDLQKKALVLQGWSEEAPKNASGGAAGVASPIGSR